LNPQAFNRYSYVVNNPLKYTDPSGHWFDLVIEAASISFDLQQMGSDPSWQNAAILALDVALAFVPGVPGVFGLTIKGGKKASKFRNPVNIEGRIEGVRTGVSRVGGEAAEGVGEGVGEDVVEGTAKQSVSQAAKNAVISTHHMVPFGNNRWTPIYKNIVDKYELDLDGAWNKIDAYQNGRHTDSYHLWVLDQLIYADELAEGNTQKFLEYFDQLVRKQFEKDPNWVFRFK